MDMIIEIQGYITSYIKKKKEITFSFNHWFLFDKICIVRKLAFLIYQCKLRYQDIFYISVVYKHNQAHTIFP